MADAVQAYPLHWPAGWPRTPQHERERARFSRKDHSSQWSSQKRLTVADGRYRVLRELDRFTRPGKPWRIPMDQVVISTNMATRNDGLPRSGAREPDDAGCAVYFQLDGEPMVLACDKWDRLADNLAAIAKTLDAMRGLDRWGVSDMLRRAFAGFSALPTPETAGGVSWRQVLEVGSDCTLAEVERAYKVLRSKHHTDHGGDPARFHAVQQAIEQARAELGGVE